MRRSIALLSIFGFFLSACAADNPGETNQHLPLLLLEHDALLPGKAEPAESWDNKPYRLFVYLLWPKTASAKAGQDKLMASLQGLVCGTSRRGETMDHIDQERGVVLVPLKTDVSLQGTPDETTLQTVLDKYDSDRASDLLMSSMALANAQPRQDGIYLVVVSQPIKQGPKFGEIYDVSAMSASNIPTWIATYVSKLQYGYTLAADLPVKTPHPPFGQVVHNFAPDFWVPLMTDVFAVKIAAASDFSDSPVSCHW